MPSYASRKGERCGSAASESHIVSIRGKAVTLSLCKLHLRVLLNSRDPAARARTWAPESTPPGSTASAD